MRPQPNVEISTEQPELQRRIELGAVVPARWPDEVVKRFASYLSAQSNLPWTNYTWLGTGHTIPCDSWLNPEFTFALLQSEHSAVPTPGLDPQLEDPVSILWFVPISATERQKAIDRGSSHLKRTLPANRWKHA